MRVEVRGEGWGEEEDRGEEGEEDGERKEEALLLR